MFLFEMLKFFPGKIEWLGTFIIPSAAVLILFLLPFLDRSAKRHASKRKISIAVMGLVVLAIVGLTIRAVATTPPQEEPEAIAASLSESILAGQDLYAVQCADCHGPDGDGGEIKGVEGLEGFIMKPINSQDEMYTRSDATMFEIINFGQPGLGMPPFGKAYGGEFSVGEIEATVNFMRYTWDDRAELPQEVVQASALPVLGENEVPSYETHIAPLVKRYCLSCHRPGKKNNNYLMQTYEETMTSGDYGPNVVPFDLDNNLILMINRIETEAGGPMPPTKALKPEVIEIFSRWVQGGAPNTAADAAAASLETVITPTLTLPNGLPISTTLTAPETTAIPGTPASQTP